MIGLSTRKAAAQLGISHVALWQAGKAGRVPVLADGTYDVDACRTALEQNSNPVKARAGRSQPGHLARQAELAAAVEPQQAELVESSTPTLAAKPGISMVPAHESISEAQRQLEWEKLREKRLKLDRESGQLVALDAVNAFVAGMIIRAREDLMRIGREEAGALSQTSDPIKCERIVEGRICQALEKLSQYQAAA